MRDFGIDLLLVIESDSSSAKAVASGRRLGKQRHVQTLHLFPDMFAAHSFVIKKVQSLGNIRDILTTVIDRKTLNKYLMIMVFVEV